MFIKKSILFGLLACCLQFCAIAQDVFQAARTGDMKQLELLVGLNKDTVNAISEQGFSPLMIACYRGKDSAAYFLINHGADINRISAEGTVLMALCYQNNTALATYLLTKKPANLNVLGPDGNNALMYAVLNQNEALVKLLVASKIDLNARNKDGQTAHSLSMTLANTAIQNMVKPGSSETKNK